MRIEDFDAIIQSLMNEAVKEDTFFEIRKIVSLIDSLQEKYDEDINAQNLALNRWQEYEELYLEYEKDKENVPHPICFMGIRDILEKYMAKDLTDSKVIFALIMEICEFFY